jgi:hypothetical protein
MFLMYNSRQSPQLERKLAIGDQMNGKMLRNELLWFAAILFAAAGASLSYAAAGNVFMGTWQLNEAKSKLPAGSAKDSTVIYSVSGGSITCTIDGTEGAGQPLHNTWTGKFDGKEYPVTGDPSTDTRSYRMITSHILAAVEMKGGRVVGRARVVVSSDGKTRTVTVHNTGANGATVTSIAVYDKQ